MTVVATFSIPAAQFVLGSILSDATDARIRLESMVPTGATTLPCFWVPTEAAETVETTLLSSPLVEGVRVVDRSETESLFRVEWEREVDSLVGIVSETDGIILKASGDGDDWRFRVRFPAHRNLSSCYRRCVETRLSIRLVEVDTDVGTREVEHYGLTPAQFEALERAFAAGYFAVPRETTLADLAVELGISDTALSQRLRRGLRTLLATTVGRQDTDTQR